MNESNPPGRLPPISELLTPECFPHPADAVELLETHISWVLLAGDYAYKLKKPVDLGFLDFSTLDRRAHFCAEELRINRRLAPELYLDVVTLRRVGDRYRFGSDGELIEYAVRMRRFQQDQQLDRCLQRDDLDAADVDEMASLIGAFHQSAPQAPPDSEWGTPAVVAAPAMENFSQLGPLLMQAFGGDVVNRLRAWTEDRLPAFSPAFERRRRQGRVRECHGDLHLRNMARVGGRIVAFDAIEFDPALRWIDVMSDSAFLIMDLESRGRRDLAWRFLNGWLHFTGDFGGLEVLQWYLVYRHMVRAKVDAIRIDQGGLEPGEAERLRERIGSHLSMALRLTEPPAPVLLVTCGVSGSGKSWLAERLAQKLPAVWLRSDVERKRLYGMSPTERPSRERTQELYGASATRKTYALLAEMADTALGHGYSVIADATYLNREDRKTILEVATRRRLPALILACDAPDAVLRERVRSRQRADRDASDAGIAVLDLQLKKREPPENSEPVLTVRTDDRLDLDRVESAIEAARGAARK